MSSEHTPPWHAKHECCLNCGTYRFPHKSRGYCSRCYPRILKIEKFRKQIEDRPPRGFPKRGTEEIKISILEGELDDLRTLEAPLNNGASASDIEGLITTLAKVTGASARGAMEYYGSKELWDRVLDSESKQWLYLVLLDIVEHLPSQNLRRPWGGRGIP